MFDGSVNFMKSAVLTCDALTTVSETYATEIKYPYYAHGLAGVISDHDFKLSGIVNGIIGGRKAHLVACFNAFTGIYARILAFGAGGGYKKAKAQRHSGNAP